MAYLPVEVGTDSGCGILVVVHKDHELVLEHIGSDLVVDNSHLRTDLDHYLDFALFLALLQ